MKFSNSKIDAVGEIIRKNKGDNDFLQAVDMLNAWRENYGIILDKYYGKCIRLSRKFSQNTIVAQRLKRFPTIVDKLNRFEDMKLSRMHDIAGVRIIVKNMDELNAAKRKITRWKHCIKVRDYINSPKTSGYRGVHFIFKDNNQYVEIQLRTQMQHLWATSVETTDVFRGSAMKTCGDNTFWNEFFLLVSNSFAYAEETALLPQYVSINISETMDALRRMVQKHGILKMIGSMAYTDVVYRDERFKNAYYALLDIDLDKKHCSVVLYEEEYYDTAVGDYSKLEKDQSRNHSTVLVAVSDIKNLKKAYPNYFNDLTLFSHVITLILENYKK